MTREEKLAMAVMIILLDLHPVYGSTAGRYGGIGGQTVTSFCSINSPGSEIEQDIRNEFESLAREVFRENEGTDRKEFWDIYRDYQARIRRETRAL